MSDGPAGAPSWPLRPNHPTDLFAGLAEDYARFRPAYPGRMLDDLRERAGLPAGGALLDLACGTGELALALQPWFADVLAVDQEPDMVATGREKAAGLAGVRWEVGRAEDLELAAGSLDMITVGNAFHRLDRRLVADRSRDWLRPGRCLVVAGSSSLWSGTAEWQPLVIEATRRWLPERTDGPAPTPDAPAEPPQPRMTHEDVLVAAGFADVAEHQFPTEQRWTVDSFLGYLRSTSVFSRAGKAGVAAELEADLRRVLHDYDPAGTYVETVDFYYILARRPAA